MGSRAYTVDGYGCYTRDLQTSKDNFLKLIKEAKLEDDLKKYIEEYTGKKNVDITKIIVTPHGRINYEEEDIVDEDGQLSNGYYSHEIALNYLAMAISKDIESKSGETDAVNFLPCSEGQTDAILIECCVPWFYLDKPFKPLTKEGYEGIFNKWIEIYGKRPSEHQPTSYFDYVSVEQYG